MAQGSRLVSDVLNIMRRAIMRRNTNNSDTNDAMLLSYLNDFVSLKAPNDMRIVEDFGTLSFTIDDTTTDGVYTFNDVGASSDFMTISNEAFISLLDPVSESYSWQPLEIYRDPGEFFSYWGINNEDVITTGYPSEMLFYGNEMTFRTIPDDEYIVKIYGYKKRNNFDSTSEQIPYDYLLRYWAYGAALDYARDFNYSADKLAMLERIFRSEKNNIMFDIHKNVQMKGNNPSF